MSQISSSKNQVEESSDENSQIITGELLEIPSATAAPPLSSGEEPTVIAARRSERATANESADEKQKSYFQYVALPLIFLTVALLGGLRLSAEDDALVFLKPALVCLIYASVTLVLFFRAGLLNLEGWFSERFSTLKNIANASVLLALFFATTQIFNSLLPERGLPFWVFAFCFFWTLWNNLFIEFQGRRLLQSLGSVFAFAFVIKYLLLAYLTAPASQSWWRGLLENPTQETFTWLLDLPRFSAGTGYIQFFAVIFYLLGLFLLPSSTKNQQNLR